MSNTYVPPVLEATTDKNDALDWNTLPNEKCDLNYRPLKARPPLIHLRTVGVLMLISFVSLPTVYVLHRYTGTAFATASGFVVSMLIGAILALVFQQLGFSLKQIVLGFFG